MKAASVAPGSDTDGALAQSVSRMPKPKPNKIHIAVSVWMQFPAGWEPVRSSARATIRNLISQISKRSDNILAGYSSGIFAAKVGVPRLLRMLRNGPLGHRAVSQGTTVPYTAAYSGKIVERGEQIDSFRSIYLDIR